MCPKLTVIWIVHSWLSSLRFSLTFICQCLWIVHSWLLLQSRVPKVCSALDCPFLIAPVISCVQSWQCLWIVHSWLLLQSRVPKIDSALDCPFLIVPSVFSKVYFSVSLDCPFLIAPSISCAQSWQCSGLSIFDCSFNLVCPKLTVIWIVHSWLSSLRFSLTFICQCLWIVHSWLLLQSRVSKVSSALDCPFLIAPSISCAQSCQCSGLSILDCSFNPVCPKLTVLWIVHSWLLLQFRVSKVDSVSGLSILDCSFNVVCPKLRVLWIVHSWLLLQSRVPKVESALDCTFLIVPSVFSNVYLSMSLDCPFLIAPSISCA